MKQIKQDKNEERIVTVLSELDLEQTEKLLNGGTEDIGVKLGKRSRNRIEKSVFERINKDNPAPDSSNIENAEHELPPKKQKRNNRATWQFMPLVTAVLLEILGGTIGLYLINQDRQNGAVKPSETPAPDSREPRETQGAHEAGGEQGMNLIEYKDYIIKEIVALPEGDYNKDRVREHIQSIKAIDLKFLQSMYLKGNKIVFVNERYSTIPLLHEKLDNHSLDAVYILISDTAVYENDYDYDIFYAGQKHNERLALFHGIGHIIDAYLFGGALSSDSELGGIAKQEWAVFTENPIPYPPISESYRNWQAGGPQEYFSTEYFASAFEIYFIEDKLGYDFLKEYAPLTFAYLEKILYESYNDEHGNMLL